MNVEEERTMVWTKLQNALRFEQTQLQRHKQKIDENPVEAFEWADKAIRSAARLQLYKIVENDLSAGLTPAEVLEDVDHVMLMWMQGVRLSSSMSQSTRAMNIAKGEVASVWLGPENLDSVRNAVKRLDCLGITMGIEPKA